MRHILVLISLPTLLILMSCSPSVPHLEAQKIYIADKLEEGDTEVFDPRVDILFVIDNSGSMGGHQSNLAKNIDKFISAFNQNQFLDYHIGVITTDVDGYRQDCCGKLVDSYVDRNTSGGLNRLKSTIVGIGINGSGTEKVFDPIVLALSNPLLSGVNAGFYRQDAFLAVVFITDAEDQSKDFGAKATYDFLAKLKGRSEKLLSYGAIIPSNVYDCDRDDTSATPSKIEEFLGYVVNSGTNTLNLCDPDYGLKLADIGKDLARSVASVIYLNRAPDVESIKVMFGSYEIPRDLDAGWSFDPERNAVILGENIQWPQQPAGTQVKVSYTAAKFKEEKP